MSDKIETKCPKCKKWVFSYTKADVAPIRIYNKKTAAMPFGIGHFQNCVKCPKCKKWVAVPG